MSDIETRLLRYFVAVAEALHFAHAAERLGISPPTLTHQIQKLEREVGAKLLRRKGNRKVAITAAGQRVLTLARDALQRVEEVPVVARQAERGELGRLQLGFVAGVSSAGLLDSWIGPFEQAHPAIDITMHKLVPRAQIAGILRKELDAGFTRAPHKYPAGIRGFEIYRQPLMLALPSEHPLARHKAISPAMLAREAFVSTTVEIDLGFFGHTEAIAGIGNFIPRMVKRDDDLIAVLAYVGRGHGIAVVPELIKKTMNVSNVVFRNIAADPVPQASIAFVYGRDPSPSAKLLIQHMRRHALRNNGSTAAPPNRIASSYQRGLTMTHFRHPDAAAKRPSKDAAHDARAVALRGSARSLSSGRPKAGPVGAEHLHGEEMSQQ
jgi:DNA-binding transcriptional LysR family regulator